MPLEAQEAQAPGGVQGVGRVVQEGACLVVGLPQACPAGLHR